MTKVIVLGGGVCGLAAGLMLARDGHEVTVLERDPAPVPDSPEQAWEGWERGGVAQFRQAHVPAAARAARARRGAAGRARRDGRRRGARVDWTAAHDAADDRRPRAAPGRRAARRRVTARRPTLEQALARAAEAQDGARGAPRHGRRAARDARRRRLHVTGVCDRRRRAAGGRPRRRRDGPPLAAARAAARRRRRDVAEEAEDSGFIYYTRFYRSPDGSTPMPRAPVPDRRSSRSRCSRCPPTAGTWSVTLYAAAGDRAAQGAPPRAGVRRPSVRACPLHAHWLEGEPITGVDADGRRRGPVPALAGDGLRDRPGAARRRVGVHEPVARPRHGARARCTRRCCAPWCASTAATRPRSRRPGTRRRSASWRRGTARRWPPTGRGWRQLRGGAPGGPCTGARPTRGSRLRAALPLATAVDAGGLPGGRRDRRAA